MKTEIERILKLRQEANGLNKLMHMRVITLDEDGGATVELDLTDELLNRRRLSRRFARYRRRYAGQQYPLLPAWACGYDAYRGRL